MAKGGPRGVLLISYHFPPCTSIGMQRTLRFARHLPLFGWRPVILTVREDDFIGEPVEKDWQHRIPTATTVCRARVLRPLEMALTLRSLWQRLRPRSVSTSPAPPSKPRRTSRAPPSSHGCSAGSIRGSPPQMHTSAGFRVRYGEASGCCGLSMSICYIAVAHRIRHT